MVEWYTTVLEAEVGISNDWIAFGSIRQFLRTSGSLSMLKILQP